MLADPLLQKRYRDYLKNLIDLCEKEIIRTKDQPEFNRLAHMYHDKYKHDYYIFNDKYNGNLIPAFKYFQDIGKLEVITCTATHGYLPLMTITPEAVKAQIAVGVKTYERFLGRKPRGIWLAECAYVPEVEKYLLEQGIQFIITETHGITYAESRPVYGTYSPIVSPNGLVAFGRDLESSRQVWSADEGYPGDVDYREYYRDIGYDLDFEYIKPYINKDGIRHNTGIKYYRITGKTKINNHITLIGQEKNLLIMPVISCLIANNKLSTWLKEWINLQ
jgi:1,4-alpha-glucan branching enzyme